MLAKSGSEQWAAMKSLNLLLVARTSFALPLSPIFSLVLRIPIRNGVYNFREMAEVINVASFKIQIPLSLFL